LGVAAVCRMIAWRALVVFTTLDRPKGTVASSISEHA
jgi:hypothetical protein